MRIDFYVQVDMKDEACKIANNREVKFASDWECSTNIHSHFSFVIHSVCVFAILIGFRFVYMENAPLLSRVWALQ